MNSAAAAGDPATEITDRIGQTLRAILPADAVRIRATGDAGDGWTRTAIEFQDSTGVFRGFALDQLPAYEAAAITGDMITLRQLMSDTDPWDSFVITVDRTGSVTADYASAER
ncbi:hypothetical protein [Nocardia goodfellowii]|uniref:Uncharacterized protein n=1 Tax=Nocardia goodfellowii TaxID=882446 RepID=A0ABS4QDZ1_9NOCA|nr:hypothetical protein [Nocardia goodfellowii]MBP2189778.1 hypothetical protein [Nocardia goodfellowii]